MKPRVFFSALAVSLMTITSVAFAAQQTVLNFNFDDGQASGWQEYSQVADKKMELSDGVYTTPADTSIKTLVGQDLSDFTIDVDVKVLNSAANSGVVFRVTDPKAENGDFFNGYAVGVDTQNGNDGTVYIGRFDQNWNEIGRSAAITGLLKDKTAHLKVVAKEADISVYLNDGKDPVVQAKDDKYASGAVGLRSHFAAVSFDNFVVTTEAAEEAAAVQTTDESKTTVESNPKTGDVGTIGFAIIAALSGSSSLVLLKKRSK